MARARLLLILFAFAAALLEPVGAQGGGSGEVPLVSAFPRTPEGVPVVPMVFPVHGPTRWSDTWGAPRSNGRRHQGQDLMAPKLRALVAAWDGTVVLHGRGTHNMLQLRGDHGYTAWYMHLNNDTPGTDDGLCTEEYVFAPGLRTGDRVIAGQLVGWVGDSGNAENTGPHCHFELHGPEGVINAAPSLRTARKLPEPLAASSPLPEPQLPGESRWDGVVREYHPEWRLAIIDLAAHTTGGKLASVTAPRRQWIKLGKARFSELEAGAGETVEPLPGQRLSILGLESSPGKGVVARVAVLHSEPADDRVTRR